MTQAVVIRGKKIPRYKSFLILGVSALLLVLGCTNLGFGFTLDCNYYINSSCKHKFDALITTGTIVTICGLGVFSVGFNLELKIRKVLRNQSTTVQQPVNDAFEHPMPDASTFPTVPTDTDYSPPYSPPTGGTPYPKTPSENEAPSTVGFAAASEPTQQYSKDVAQPFPHAP